MSYNFNAMYKLINRTEEMGHDSIIIRCGCNHPEHMLEIGKWNDDDDYYVTITLNHYLPWYKRLIPGIHYIFGKKPNNIMFTELWLNQGQWNEVFNFVKEDI